MKIDFDHPTGAMLASDMIDQLDLDRRLSIVGSLKPKLLKEGNQWMYLYGENVQEGVCGFGDTPFDAMNDFVDRFYNEKITKNEQTKNIHNKTSRD